jgi:hypothetical protein
MAAAVMPAAAGVRELGKLLAAALPYSIQAKKKEEEEGANLLSKLVDLPLSVCPQCPVSVCLLHLYRCLLPYLLKRNRQSNQASKRASEQLVDIASRFRRSPSWLATAKQQNKQTICI